LYGAKTKNEKKKHNVSKRRIHSGIVQDNYLDPGKGTYLSILHILKHLIMSA